MSRDDRDRRVLGDPWEFGEPEVSRGDDGFTIAIRALGDVQVVARGATIRQAIVELAEKVAEAAQEDEAVQQAEHSDLAALEDELRVLRLELALARYRPTDAEVRAFVAGLAPDPLDLARDRFSDGVRADREFELETAREAHRERRRARKVADHPHKFEPVDRDAGLYRHEDGRYWLFYRVDSADPPTVHAVTRRSPVWLRGVRAGLLRAGVRCTPLRVADYLAAREVLPEEEDDDDDTAGGGPDPEADGPG